MDLINPNEIGSKISTLIIESQEKFIAVTPYIDISEWKKILINLENAIKRGVNIEFYFREIKEEDYQVLNKLDIKLYEVKGLHTKLYLNESSVIVTSMNLYEYSDLHSIDVALHFETSKDYNELYHYFTKYVKNKKSFGEFISKASEKKLKEIHRFLSERFSDFRITSTKTYLFSKNLIPIFDVFINKSLIELKYPIKNPSFERIKEISEIVDAAIDIEFELTNYNTSEETTYYKWNINIEDFSEIEIANLITELQEIGSTLNN